MLAYCLQACSICLAACALLAQLAAAAPVTGDASVPHLRTDEQLQRTPLLPQHAVAVVDQLTYTRLLLLLLLHSMSRCCGCSPVPHVVETVLCEELGDAVVEVRVKLVDDALVFDHREQPAWQPAKPAASTSAATAATTSCSTCSTPEVSCWLGTAENSRSNVKCQ